MFDDNKSFDMSSSISLIIQIQISLHAVYEVINTFNASSSSSTISEWDFNPLLPTTRINSSSVMLPSSEMNTYGNTEFW